MMPALLGLGGGVADLYIHEYQASSLQNAADSAALAAAREASLKGWDEKTANEVANKFLSATLAEVGMNRAEYRSEVQIETTKRSVSVTIEQDGYGYFLLGYFKSSPQIKVNAVAASNGDTNVCIIAKSDTEKQALELSGDARVFAHDCAAYSNSIDPAGLSGKKSSVLRTKSTCSAGGYEGRPANFYPLPLTDCPKIEDPLMVRAKMIDSAYPSDKCNYVKLELKAVHQILHPGVYCGDTKITDGTIAYLRPGVYVFDGKLVIDKKATIIGENVGFVFSTKKDSVIEFKNESTIALSAPESGLLAGILFYAKSAKSEREFKIESNDAKRLIGTVYLPGDKLKIGADENGDGICDRPFDITDDGANEIGEIGDAVSNLCQTNVGSFSAWTAIVVNKLKVTNGVDLVINTDYDSSPIPVPDGIGPIPGSFRLVR